MSDADGILDCITHDIIPPGRRETISEKEAIYEFDIETLVKYYISSGELRNPYTTNILPLEVRVRVENYANISMYYSGKKINISGVFPIGDVIPELFKLTGSQFDVISCDILVNDVSLYNYPLEDKLMIWVKPEKNHVISFNKGINPLHLGSLLTFINKSGGSRDKTVIKTFIQKELYSGSVVKI